MASSGMWFAATALIAVTITPATGQITGMTAARVGYDTKAVDPRRDPWVVVTHAMVAPSLARNDRAKSFRRRVSVDYDADGVMDSAYMVRNRTQMGVLVRLGRSGRTVLAFRARDMWSDQSLSRWDNRTVRILFPESTFVLLSSESGRPMVYYLNEGD